MKFKLGDRVRIIRGMYSGELATVISLPFEEDPFEDDGTPLHRDSECNDLYDEYFKHDSFILINSKQNLITLNITISISL